MTSIALFAAQKWLSGRIYITKGRNDPQRIPHITPAQLDEAWQQNDRMLFDACYVLAMHDKTGDLVQRGEDGEWKPVE